MDLLQGNTKTIYFKHLGAAFGNVLISAVYSTMDIAMVGQYQGSEGAAALAVVAPVWNIIYSLGLLTGIGGSVLSGATKGKNERRTGGEYFMAALVITVVLIAVGQLMVLFLSTPMLRLFGAEETLLPLARGHLHPIKFMVPLFLFNQMLAASLRSDGNPGLAVAVVLSGDIFNIIEGCLSVFVFDMEIMGAGFATVVGAGITLAGMISHSFIKKGTMRPAKLNLFRGKCRRVIVTGFSTFSINVAMGVLIMLFNRRIMKYLGGSTLPVYSVIVNISTIVQCCTYSVGQAPQLIFFIYFGMGRWGRVKETLKYALYSVACFSVVWTLLVSTLPNGFIRIFMVPTGEIYYVAPFILRSYRIFFPLLPPNAFSTRYFQALMKPGASFLVPVLRGLILSGIMTYLLPVAAGPDSLWFAMVITGAAVAVLVVFLIHRYTREPPAG